MLISVRIIAVRGPGPLQTPKRRQICVCHLGVLRRASRLLVSVRVSRGPSCVHASGRSAGRYESALSWLAHPRQSPNRDRFTALARPVAVKISLEATTVSAVALNGSTIVAAASSTSPRCAGVTQKILLRFMFLRALRRARCREGQGPRDGPRRLREVCCDTTLELADCRCKGVRHIGRTKRNSSGG